MPKRLEGLGEIRTVGIGIGAIDERGTQKTSAFSEVF